MHHALHVLDTSDPTMTYRQIQPDPKGPVSVLLSLHTTLKMSTLTIHFQWEDRSVKDWTDHPQSAALYVSSC